ncbi:hypothetical protein AYI70_g1788 [Smittium culicis]|uniref:Uncharacterized protein n=1 Tax=Smittium culicis TaxID=133412 RepID=A0A1R1YBT7_9FUNG|nr:hypothetical protein AYI70_g1788 [Smittium culicis]
MRRASQLASKLSTIRSISTSRFVRSSAPSNATESSSKAKSKPKTFAGIRGGMFGFLLGATLSGGYGFYYLIEQYQSASSLILSSVNELEKTANTIQEYVRKIDSFETQLSSLQQTSATKAEIEKLRAEGRKLSDIFTKDYLEVKAHLLVLEQAVDK